MPTPHDYGKAITTGAERIGWICLLFAFIASAFIGAYTLAVLMLELTITALTLLGLR